MKTYLFGLAVSLALAVGMPAARAQNNQDNQDGVPRLDHVFVIVLENHNSFTSFGSIGILDNPQAPQIRALAQKYNVAPNYRSEEHTSELQSQSNLVCRLLLEKNTTSLTTRH